MNLKSSTNKLSKYVTQIPIVGFENYLISENGSIYSLISKKNIASSLSHNGYIGVSLSKLGKAYRLSLHSLIAKSFIPKKQGCNYVNHKDLNKLNNDILNLEWVTAKENVTHFWKNGKTNAPMGERNGQSILKDDDVKTIIKLLKDNIKIVDIAKMFNVSHSLISAIKNKKRWKHIKI